METERKQSLTNPDLTANIMADYEALQNDLIQANELAAENQRQLSGKANECAHFKQVLDKTKRDLAHLEAGITELRQERHRLANQAMRVTALEQKLKVTTEERDRLIAERQAVQEALISADEKVDRYAEDQDAQIAWLTAHLDALKQRRTELHGNMEGSQNCERENMDVSLILADILKLIERRMPDSRGYTGKAQQIKRTNAFESGDSGEFIDISFSK